MVLNVRWNSLHSLGQIVLHLKLGRINAANGYDVSKVSLFVTCITVPGSKKIATASTFPHLERHTD